MRDAQDELTERLETARKELRESELAFTTRKGYNSNRTVNRLIRLKLIRLNVLIRLKAD